MRSPLPALAVAGLVLAGCAATEETNGGGPTDADHVVAAHAEEPGMPCSQATRVARQTLVKMGYTIATVETAKPDTPGKVVGHKTSGWSAGTPEPGKDATVFIRIKCSDKGADFDAVTNEGFFARIGFRQDFATAITAAAREKTRSPSTDQRAQQGLIIEVEPQRSHEAVAQFGVDLPRAGITPVQLRLQNKTQRTYAFAVDNVRLVTQEGTRVASLPVAEATSKAGAGVGATLEEKVITDGELAPGATRAGFLYFPSSAYRRATITLIDRESEETEGFSVEF